MAPRTPKGFTLIELLIVIAIGLVLVTGIFAAYERFAKNQRLRQAAATLKNNLRFAQSKAVHGDKPSSGCSELAGYAVAFGQGTYSIGAQCREGAVGSVTSILLPTTITFSASPAPLLFSALYGTVDTDTTLTLTDGSQTKSVRVTQSGDINEL